MIADTCKSTSRVCPCHALSSMAWLSSAQLFAWSWPTKALLLRCWRPLGGALYALRSTSRSVRVGFSLSFRNCSQLKSTSLVLFCFFFSLFNNSNFECVQQCGRSPTTTTKFVYLISHAPSATTTFHLCCVAAFRLLAHARQVPLRPRRQVETALTQMQVNRNESVLWSDKWPDWRKLRHTYHAYISKGKQQYFIKCLGALKSCNWYFKSALYEGYDS